MIKYNDSYWEDVAKAVKCIPNVSELFGKSILITGATGMIGSSVVEMIYFLNIHCDADIKMLLAGRSKERIKNRFPMFDESHGYDYIEYDATKDVGIDIYSDYIIHAASNANPAIYTKEPVETMLANIVGLNSLLNTVKKKKNGRLLYISSSEVYGKKDHDGMYREEDYGFLDILNQRASYPSSKRAAETLCVAYAEEYGIETVIVRPGHIYGPSITRSDSRASAQFTRNACAHEDIVLKSAGNQLRSYCYTLDCASAILAVLINGQKCNAYNISNKDSIVSIRDIAEALAAVSGVNVIFENPSDLEKKGYNLMDSSALNSYKLESLGWTAAFSLDNGIKRTYDHYMI